MAIGCLGLTDFMVPSVTYSYVYTTRNRIVRTNKDVLYFTLFTKYHATKYNYGFVGKKYWLPYKKINGHYFYYIGYGAYIKARNVSLINDLPQYSNGEKAMVDETSYPFTFNSKTKKITHPKIKYKKSDYIVVDGLRQFTANDGFVFWDARSTSLCPFKRDRTWQYRDIYLHWRLKR
ncbi:hypothetical protein LOB96_02920 [Lactobacillus delbrueckii subsp. lactis]|nr:hypothetical protein [Lactobacillus delbrueckii subsp. lactis]